MNPRSVECPVCKAAVGMVCREPDGRTLPWRASHPARVEVEPIDAAALATAADAARTDCCGNDAWRGHFCQYHQGFEDGYDAALSALQPEAATS